jgi:beta-glucosidase
MSQRAFPDGFVWGAATSSYQIEGAVDVDGRGPSIWDTFSRTPGMVRDGDTGDVAADHYHRWAEDVAIMGELGLGAYRFSIAWPRILPTGRGTVNQPGLDFYDRLVDGLLAAGIDPFVTLYHWDLPQALEDEGGWPVRSTAEAFADYAGIVADRLGDRVRHWTTLNEPWVTAGHGYLTGEHAPGRRSTADAVAASHHLLLAHGLAVDAIRAAVPHALVGIVLDLEAKHPASPALLDLEAASLEHALMGRWYLDPIAGLGYPEDGVVAYAWDQAEVADGDMAVIARPLDFLGINYYTRQIVRHPDSAAEPTVRPGTRVTGMGWEVYPAGLTDALEWAWRRSGIGAIYVTENGAAYPVDRAEPERDPDRVAFLHDHLVAAADAMERGVPLRGYFAWSLLDNFEWAHGYAHRFGIVHVDFETLERRIRDSGRYWSAVAASGLVEPPGYDHPAG